MANYKHSLINTEAGVLVLPRVDDLTLVTLEVPDVRAESSAQKFPIGAALLTDDGVYRYAKCGASAVTMGKLLQQAAVGNSAQIKDIAVAVTAAIGDKEVTITTPTGDLTINYLKDGFLWVNDATTRGTPYKIKSHPAATAAAACVITLVDPLEVALTAGTSTVGVRKNLYDGVIVNPVTPTGIPVGVVNHSSFTASYYAWIKTKGIVAVLTNGTLILGNNCIASAYAASVAGAVSPHDNDAATNAVIVGMVESVGADTEHSLVKIDLDPSW